jgi:hypothetical protein
MPLLTYISSLALSLFCQAKNLSAHSRYCGFTPSKKGRHRFMTYTFLKLEIIIYVFYLAKLNAIRRMIYLLLQDRFAKKASKRKFLQN